MRGMLGARLLSEGVSMVSTDPGGHRQSEDRPSGTLCHSANGNYHKSSSVSLHIIGQTVSFIWSKLGQQNIRRREGHCNDSVVVYANAQ